jgi:hypothetical protein
LFGNVVVTGSWRDNARASGRLIQIWATTPLALDRLL